ncbi:MAG: HAD family hydrolase [Thermosulfidibacteraceae bacterium]|jgi:putative hydrolase of the HAD superfamily
MLLKDRVRLICLDFWETIVDFVDKSDLVKLRNERVKRIADILSLDVTLVSERYDRVIKEMCDIREKTCREFTVDEFIDNLLFSLEVERNYLEEVKSIFVETVKKYIPGPVKGVREFLDYLKDKGYLLAIVSNTINGKLERELLKEYELFDYFDFVVFSSEVKVRKPSRDIFYLVLSRLGIPNYVAIHIGDDPVSDVFGALNAGMWAGHYSKELTLPHAHFTFNNWEKLREFL